MAIKIPSGIPFIAFQSKFDPVVDSKSLEYLKSVIENTEEREFIYVNSNLHVFTRLHGKDPKNITAQDRQNQQTVFEKMQALLNP